MRRFRQFVVGRTPMQLSMWLLRVAIVTLLAGAIVTVATQGPHGQKLTSQTYTDLGSVLGTNQYMHTYDFLASPNGQYTLVMQSDGNLVEYNRSSQALWASGTTGNPNDMAVMQSDGNFVIYSSSNRPLWASGTGDHPAAAYRLNLQDDANLVVYGPSGALWSRMGGTVQPPQTSLPYGEGSNFCGSVVPGHTFNLSASFDNVYACGPEPGYQFPSYGDRFQPHGGFQCTELANRFVADVWHVKPVYGTSLDGANYVSALRQQDGVSTFPNGSRRYIQPGDILSFSGGYEDQGHVAVIIKVNEDSAGDGSLTILEENSPLGPKGTETLQIHNWEVQSNPHGNVVPSEIAVP